MSIEISPYLEKDVSELSRVHLKAFRGYMNASMGKAYIKQFLKWFKKEPGTVTLKATYGGEICGYVIGAPIGYTAKMNKDLLNQVLLSVASHPKIFFHPKFLKTAWGRFIGLFKETGAKKVLRQADLKGISLVGIAVDSDFSGKGVGRSLISAFEEEAKHLGMNYMRLSVYEENDAARRVYEKSGWKEEDRNGTTLIYIKDI